MHAVFAESAAERWGSDACALDDLVQRLVGDGHQAVMKVLSLRIERLCRFAGDMSYPLYITHDAVIWSFEEYYERLSPARCTLPSL